MNRREISAIAFLLVIVYGMTEIIIGLYGWGVIVGIISLWLVLIAGKPGHLWNHKSDNEG